MASQLSMRFGPSAATAAPTTSFESMEYVEFFLASLWTWPASGVDRALDYLRGLNTVSHPSQHLLSVTFPSSPGVYL